MLQERIGVCSWSLETSDPQELAAVLDRLKIDALQYEIVSCVEGDVDGDAVDRLRKADVRVISAMVAMHGEDYSSLDTIRETGGVRPDETWEANRQRVIDCAAFAAANDLGLVTFHAGFLPERASDPERDKLFERLRFIAEQFGERGIEVALETGQESAETLLAALEEIDCQNLGVNFDPANMILYGSGDPLEALRLLSAWVKQIHIKDAIAPATQGEWGREVPAGDGDVDWPAFFDITQTIDPAVNFVIERETGEQREEDIAKARELLERHL